MVRRGGLEDLVEWETSRYLLTMSACLSASGLHAASLSYDDSWLPKSISGSHKVVFVVNPVFSNS